MISFSFGVPLPGFQCFEFDCLINHDQQCSVGPEKHAVLNGKVMPLLAETACRSSGISSRGEKKSNHIGFLMLFWSKKI